MYVEAGSVFISGKDKATARALLDAAEALGYDPTIVRTTISGFKVPDDVYEKAAPALGADNPIQTSDQF